MNRHKGFSLAPWNLANYRYRLESGRLLVDDDPLVAYHFNRFRPLTSWLYDPGPHLGRLKNNTLVKRQVYLPYAREMRAARRQIKAIGARVPRQDSLRLPAYGLPDLLRLARERRFLMVTDTIAR